MGRNPSGDNEEGCAGAINKVEIAASELFSIPGIGTAYHTSIVVNGEEFFFSDSGIFSDRVMSSQALEAHFMPGTYDLLRKNCNSFSDCALSFLLKQRLDRKYSTLERYGQCISHELLKKFIDSTYQPNPAAAPYRSDAVIAELSKVGLNNLSEAASRPRRVAALAVGKRVTVVGLKNAEALNGHGAEIIGFNRYNGRWEARLIATGEVKAFRAENLRPAGELVLEPGAAARVGGLKSEAGQALNGQECMVVRYDPSTSRYDVKG